MKKLLIALLFLAAACNNSGTVTETDADHTTMKDTNAVATDSLQIQPDSLVKQDSTLHRGK
jgi:hypothetical protein